MENFIIPSKVNYICIASSQSKFVLFDLLIIVNSSKYEKTLCFLFKSKKASHSSFYEDEWFLDSSTFTYFILFESDFVDITLGNYGQVKTANSKAPLFIVAPNTILVEYKIFDPEKETTKVVVSKLWLVYYISNM